MMKQDLSAISAIKVILSMKMYKHILNQHIEETGMIKATRIEVRVPKD